VPKKNATPLDEPSLAIPKQGTPKVSWERGPAQSKHVTAPSLLSDVKEKAVPAGGETLEERKDNDKVRKEYEQTEVPAEDKKEASVGENE